ncbi:hypothetical protein BDF21DRAFT_493265 [Thamnidium elegans]|nr:hypothetical protein BDF21DRAFT_493265 [Thamnidium elegans]
MLDSGITTMTKLARKTEENVLKTVIASACRIYEKLKDLHISNKRVSSADVDVSIATYANSNCLEIKYNKAFEDTLLHQSAWLLKRVKRTVPHPLKFYSVVKTLFNESVLKEIEAGHVSDPAGMPLYRQIKTDKDGLPIHRCLQGTSSVEGGVHQNIIRKFVFFNSSPELANYALAEYSLRHNTEVGSKNEYGVPHVGHYGPWLTQRLNKLKMKLGHSFRGTYHDSEGNALFYKDGEETFGVCQIPLQLANNYRMEPYNDTPTTNNSTCHYSSANIEQLCTLPCYLAILQNILFAVVPIHTAEERRFFKTLLDSNPRFGAGTKPNRDELCVVWSGYCNDSSNSIDNIFYKAPYHLRSYYSSYIDSRMEQVFIQVSNASSMSVVESANRTSNRPEVRHVEPTNLLFFFG